MASLVQRRSRAGSSTGSSTGSAAAHSGMPTTEQWEEAYEAMAASIDALQDDTADAAKMKLARQRNLTQQNIQRATKCLRQWLNQLDDAAIYGRM
jgi:hypothetical protein